ncbi:MAG TPA: glycoside hydrolase family 3 C-terminal domain-containing protein [Rhodanobacteraceae bacterium]
MVLVACTAYAQPPPSAVSQARALVAKLTLPEKVAQLQNDAPAIPRVGIPAYNWWSEGLHGFARDGYATVFPQAIGLAASWDPGLLQQVGTVTSTEARARFNALGVDRNHGLFQGLTLWAPVINLCRDPRWGRCQETYGEDPYLTGRLAAAFIRGIQGPDPGHPRAIATPKHFAVFSGPGPGRDGLDVDVSPHDLEASYLPAFRMAVTRGHADSVMCAYTALGGIPDCANRWLLTALLRKDWGFTGFVVSDCDAVGDITHYHHYKPNDAQASAAALNAGTDLDCGHTYAALGRAVRAGDVKPAVLDRALVRLFTARYRLGMLPGADDPYANIGRGQIDTPADRKLALRAALESIVLLKNAHATLPLHAGVKIAVVGPDADTVATLEGSYHGTARDPVTPLQGLRARFGAAHVTYAQGAPIAAGVPVPIPETALTAHGHPGLQGAYFANTDFSGKPRAVRADRTIDFDWDRVAPVAGLDPRRYAVRWTGELAPPGPGAYTLAVHVARCFACTRHDSVRLVVDGKAVIDDHGSDRATLETTLHFANTSPQPLQLDLVHDSQDKGISLEWLAPAAAQLAKAVAAARAADVVVACVGLSPGVENESLPVDVPGFDHGDRTRIKLPAAQLALLQRMAATGKPLVVVLLSGDAVALDWAGQHAAAILAAWYPGEQGGRAIAAVLAGDYDPAGRLPVTFYRSVRDLPPYVSYAMQGRTYRYFTGKPLYPFGYGLSYTHFTYSGASLSTATLAAGQPLRASVVVHNAGQRAGDDVVQVYLRWPTSLRRAPLRALAGFQRVHLASGQSRRVTFTLSPRRLSTVDARGQRSVVAGRYALFIGGGQPGYAAGASVAFAITGHVRLSP